MTLKCPVCGKEGHLQIRGSSARVGHYAGCGNGTTKVQWHKLEVQDLEKTAKNGKYGKQNLSELIFIIVFPLAPVLCILKSFYFY